MGCCCRVCRMGLMPGRTVFKHCMWCIARDTKSPAQKERKCISLLFIHCPLKYASQLVKSSELFELIKPSLSHHPVRTAALQRFSSQFLAAFLLFPVAYTGACLQKLLESLQTSVGSPAFTGQSQQHQYKYFTPTASIIILCYEIVPVSFNWVMMFYTCDKLMMIKIEIPSLRGLLLSCSLAAGFSRTTRPGAY